MTAPHPLLTRADAVLIGVACALVIGSWLLPVGGEGGGRVRVVTPDNKWIFSAYPDRRVVIELQDGHMVLEFGGGRVRVAETRCLRRVCLAHGWLGGVDDAIICVPQQVVITRTGEKNCDAVTR